MNGAKSLKREGLEIEILPKFCFSFAETSLQLVNRGPWKKAETVNPLVSNANFEAGQLRRPLGKVDADKNQG